jgi:ATP-dependent protease HslVU (ClpYQ) peptidase subunit
MRNSLRTHGTTIAYRDGILACDSQWTSAEVVLSSACKIERLPSGVLYGASGYTDDRELKLLIAKVRREEDLPLASVLEKISIECQALLILPCGRVLRIMTGDNAELCPIEAPFAAVGSGQHIAIGAMAHGASAVEAVNIACDYDIYTRRPVHSLTLKKGKKHGRRI